MTKILSWNVNSLRIRLAELERIAHEENPDVVCLQEVKAKEEDFPFAAVKAAGFEHIALYGMGERAETFLTNGLDGIEPLDGDCVFICGMGGDNIADILKRAEWTKNTAVIAQPMTKQYRLRQFLKDHGYNITKERLCRDPRHFYTAMRIEKGEYKGEGHMLFSDAMRDDPLFYDYIAMLREKSRARYEGSRLEKDGLIYSMLKELV